MRNAVEEDNSNDKKDEEDHEPELLSAHPRKTAAMMAGKAHPHHELLFKAVQRSETLQEFLDMGLHRVRKDGVTWLEGFAILPHGYTGCDKDSLLIHATQAEVKIYPVSLEVTDESDGSKPQVVYHYTHRHSFDKFVAIFAPAPPKPKKTVTGLSNVEEHHHSNDDESQIPVHVRVLRQIEADYQERVPKPSVSNRKSDPELFLWEPGKFKSKKVLQQCIFDNTHVPPGYTNLGNKFQDFGDYCIAIKAPGSILASSASSLEFGGCKRIDREALHKLQTQGQIRRDNQEKKEQAEKARKAQAKKEARRSCLGFLCGGRGAEVPEFWDDLDEDEEEGNQADARTKREKREMTQDAKQKMINWTKEHFVSVKEDAENEERMKGLEDGDDEDTKGSGGGKKRGATPKRRKKKGGRLRMFDPGNIAHAGKKLLRSLTGAQEKDADALKLYDQFKKKEENKEQLKGALQTIKTTKSTNASLLVRPPRGTRRMSTLERAEMEAELKALEDEKEDRGSSKASTLHDQDSSGLRGSATAGEDGGQEKKVVVFAGEETDGSKSGGTAAAKRKSRRSVARKGVARKGVTRKSRAGKAPGKKGEASGEEQETEGAKEEKEEEEEEDKGEEEEEKSSSGEESSSSEEEEKKEQEKEAEEKEKKEELKQQSKTKTVRLSEAEESDADAEE